MKSFSKQISGFNEPTKSMIEHDILEATRKVGLITESVDYGRKADGLYHRTVTINIKTYLKKIITELMKMEKPYLQFLESYPLNL